jgi:ribosomal protein L23
LEERRFKMEKVNVFTRKGITKRNVWDWKSKGATNIKKCARIVLSRGIRKWGFGSDMQQEADRKNLSQSYQSGSVNSVV